MPRMRGFAFSPLGNLQKLDLSGIRTSFESGEGRGAPVECESLTDLPCIRKNFRRRIASPQELKKGLKPSIGG